MVAASSTLQEKAEIWQDRWKLQWGRGPCMVLDGNTLRATGLGIGSSMAPREASSSMLTGQGLVSN